MSEAEPVDVPVLAGLTVLDGVTLALGVAVRVGDGTPPAEKDAEGLEEAVIDRLMETLADAVAVAGGETVAVPVPLRDTVAVLLDEPVVVAAAEGVADTDVLDVGVVPPGACGTTVTLR